MIVNTGGGVPPLVFGPELFANPVDMMAWINETVGFDISLAPQNSPAENPTPGGPLGIRRARASNPCSTCGFGVPPNPAGNASSRERRAWAMSQIGTTPMANPCNGVCPECGDQHNPRPLTPQEASKVGGGTFNPRRAAPAQWTGTCPPEQPFRCRNGQCVTDSTFCSDKHVARPLRLRNPYNPGGGGCYPGPQPCDEGREACSYSHYGVLKAGCRHSDTFQIPDSSPTGASPGPSYATAMLTRASPMAARQSRRSRKYALALAGQVATPERVRFGR